MVRAEVISVTPSAADFVRVVPHMIGGGGLIELGRCLDGAQQFDIVRDGEVQGRYAVRVRGEVATVVAAQAGGGLLRQVEPFLIDQCARAGVRRVRCDTKRRGVVHMLHRQGWCVDAVTNGNFSLSKVL